MSNNRALMHTFIISTCLAFVLWRLVPAQAPASFGMGFGALVLIPFGALCPLLAGGCLAHGFMERLSPVLGAAFRAGAMFLAFSAALGFLFLRHYPGVVSQ